MSEAAEHYIKLMGLEGRDAEFIRATFEAKAEREAYRQRIQTAYERMAVDLSEKLGADVRAVVVDLLEPTQ